MSARVRSSSAAINMTTIDRSGVSVDIGVDSAYDRNSISTCKLEIFLGSMWGCFEATNGFCCLVLRQTN